MASALHPLLCFLRRVFDRLASLLKEMADDPQVQSALEADLGLPQGSLDAIKTKTPPPQTGIDAYINAANPKDEQRQAAIDAAKAIIKFWTTAFDPAKTGDPSVAVDEALYRLLQATTVDLIKYDDPATYAWLRLIGVIQQDVRLTLEEAFAPEVPASMFSGDYYRTWVDTFAGNYKRFRLDQDLPRDPPAPGAPPPTLAAKQLAIELYVLSDMGLAAMAVAAWALRKTGATVEQFYGWELPPRPQPAPCAAPPAAIVLPISEHIASRASTLRISDPDAGASALLTQLLMRDAQDRLAWLLSLRGAVEFEDVRGPAERPVRIKLRIAADGGLDAVVRLTGDAGFAFTGAPQAGLHLEIEPVATSDRAPALMLPEKTGTRLEIGDFSVKGGVSQTGLTFRIETHKSVLVVVTGDGDGLTQEALPGNETRIEFDLALIVDDKRGIAFEGGGRLATTLAVNKSFARVNVQTVALALTPGGTEGGSELQLAAGAGLSFDLGPVKVSLDGIGATLGLGTTRGPAPAAALPLLGPLLYLTRLGFLAPKGVGIAVESDAVNGGGYLFHDSESGQYAGALQLALGKRFTLTGVGLLSTKMPDGSKGFSLLLIASLEFNPPFMGPLNISLRGLGLLVGIHRTMNADVLRAGLRNHTLDAILFPQDPVASAARIVSSLKAVFPPARGHHLFGVTVSLGFGTTQVLVAELGIVYEWGAKRWAVLGQIHAEFPPKLANQPGKKILELHIDAVGIWDPDRGEFSLDASLYDTKIVGVSFSGDVAVRMRRGDSSFFLFSVGGYHPEFAVPPGFPALQRVKIALAELKHLKLLLTGYVAITSNTRQIGARMEFYAEFGGFSLEAIIGFDALWEEDVRFIIDFDLEFKLKYKGITFFGVDVSGRFTGPDPKRVVGEWSIDLWLTSISKSFDCTFGADRPPAVLPAVDPLPPLVAALKDARNWSAAAPASALVTFRKREGGAQVLVHPLGSLAVRQQVLPLGIRIDRFGGAALAASQRYDITSATLAARAVTGPLPPQHEQFAAAEFLTLSDDEKLARPSFESHPAGVTISPAGATFGSQTAISPMDFDDRIFGAAGGPAVAGPKGAVLSGPIALLASTFGAAARSALQERFPVAGPDLQVGRERYVVARVDDLAPTGVVAATSYTAAQQALERQPQAGALQVVFDAEAAA